jgi:hypothetical protein
MVGGNGSPVVGHWYKAILKGAQSQLVVQS